MPQTYLGGTFETPTGFGQGNLFFPPPQFTGINFGSPRSPHLLRDALTAGSFLPGIGDAAGMAADIDMYRNEPAARTPFNYALTGLGLLPFFPGMTVFHGTPHQFLPEIGAPLGKFKAEKIGTGEGAQVYGYGHYVAQAEETAKTYRDVLSGTSTIPGAPSGGSQYVVSGEFPAGRSGHAALDTAGDIDAYLSNLKMIENGTLSSTDMADYLKSKIDARVQHWMDSGNYGRKGLGSAYDDMNELVDFWIDKARNAKSADIAERPMGSLYEIDLPDEHIEKMLDWDKPLSAQPQDVQDATKALVSKAMEDAASPFSMYGTATYSDRTARRMSPDILDQMDGAAIHEMLQHVYGNSVSDELNRLGIPGIKYLDQQSRHMGEGTRNFVVFPGNEHLLTIQKRK